MPTRRALGASRASQIKRSGGSCEVNDEEVTARVNLFMNKFKKLGFVHNEGGQLHIDSSLLNIVLHEQ